MNHETVSAGFDALNRISKELEALDFLRESNWLEDIDESTRVVVMISVHQMQHQVEQALHTLRYADLRDRTHNKGGAS